MRLLLIMRLLLFTIGLKLSRGYYNRGGYYPSAVTITGNTVHTVRYIIKILKSKQWLQMRQKINQMKAESEPIQDCSDIYNVYRCCFVLFLS